MATAKTKKSEPKPYRVEKKRSGRFAVTTRTGKAINGDAKIEILVKEGHLKHASKKKAEAAAPAADAAAPAQA